MMNTQQGANLFFLQRSPALIFRRGRELSSGGEGGREFNWLLPSAMALLYVHGHVDQRFTWCFTKECMFCYIKKLSIKINFQKE